MRRLAESYHVELLNRPLAPETGDRLEECLAALAGSGHAVHLSYMVSRNPVPIKLDVNLPLEQVGGFLDKLPWIGHFPGLQQRLRGCMPWNGSVQLNLILNAAADQPLEVEFMTTPGECTFAERLAFLEMMAERGLCTGAKAQVLAEISKRSGRAEPIGPGIEFIANWYAKIRFQGDRPAEAKAYLGIKPPRAG